MNARVVVLIVLIICIVSSITRSTGIHTEGLEIIEHIKSPYQTIDLVRDKETNHIAMFLNGTLQNHTKEYKKSHYAMVDIPIKLLQSQPRNILILGGGDGYPAMRALKQENVYVKNVEIDGTLIDFVKTNPIMRELSEDAFNDPRLDLSATDAYKYIYTENRKFDVIVYDVARNVTDNSIIDFDSHDDYIIENLLEDGGVLNYTMDMRSEIPKLENIYEELKKKTIKSHHVILLQSEEDFTMFNRLYPVSINKNIKKQYPDSEIGIMILDLDSSCGRYHYNEEVYFYISKQPFNKTNEDVNFIPFRSLMIKS